MNYVVFGYKRHGKDTACEFLEARFGLKFASSSRFACDKFLFEQLRESHGYQTADQCFEDRDSHRQLWYEAIRNYNADDRTQLGRELFEEHQIYCGIRDREEFYALKEAGLFDLAIWVDASERKPPEDTTSMNLTPKDADIILTNNGTLDDLAMKLERLFSALRH